MNILAKYRPVFQAPDTPSAGGGSGSAPSGTAPASPTSPTSTPSTPSAEPGNEILESGSPESVDFTFMFGDGEEATPQEVSGSPPPPTTPSGEPKPPGGAEPPKPAPAPGTQPTEAPAAPAPTEPTSAPGEAGAQLDPYDPGALATALQANEVAAIQHVAETLFKLSPEEIEALESNTVEAIPKLMARSFIQAQKNMFQQMARLIPAMMMKQTKALEKHASNEAKFYARWPDLKPEVHGSVVQQYAAVYRQMNPQAKLDEMIEALGPMVMMASKVTPTLSPATPQPVRPASPMAANGSRPPQPSPFTPAGPVSGGATPQQVPELSAVEAMFVGPDADG